MAYVAGLNVYSLNYDLRHPRENCGGEAAGAIAVDGL
jgi:hypothetical protein